MSFTLLTSYSQTDWNNLQKSPVGPVSQFSTGAPDPNVSIQLGGWVSNTVMAFTVTDTVEAISGVVIDPSTADTIDVNIGSGAPTSATSYWTVDVGSGDGINTEWSIAFATARRGTKSGTYTFSKPKGEHPDTRHA